MHRRSKLSLLAIVLAAASTIAQAHPKARDVTALANAKVPLAQAVTAAEQHVNGKALKAEFERSWQGGGVFEVDVVSGSGQVFEVKVDADKGTVLSSVEERVRHSHEHGEHDD